MQIRPEDGRKQKAASGETADGQNTGGQNTGGQNGSEPFRRRSLKERADEYGGELNLSPEMERDEPAGREVW